ncbi:O-antigen ligase family protein [Puniceicoccaceae bacterium K14]|nr:O-antigen ligase family protein [Puniceicoccaceae bacterium K14]
MKSFFNGYERWQFFFGTPNQLATFTLVLFFLLLALGAFALSSEKRRTRFQNWLGYTFISTAIAAIPILLFTYSRGGYLSFFLCSCFSLFFKPCRKVAWLALGVFAIGLLLLPSGTERALEVLPDAADASVSNRFEVWRGTLVMISDHWAHGVGKFGFRDTYSMWYQQNNAQTTYGNAVNDYLDIAATRGIPTLFLYLTVISTTIFILLKAYQNSTQSGFVFLSLAIFSYAICGLFSAFHFIHEIRWALILTLLFSLVFAVKNLYESSKLKSLTSNISKALFLSFSICLAISLAGLKFAHHYETRVVEVSEYKISANLNANLSAPRKKDTIGTVLFIPSKKEDFLGTQKTLKHLSKLGYLAISPKLSSFGLRGLKELKEFVNALPTASLPSKDFILVGHGAGARLSLAVAAQLQPSNLSQVVIIGTRSYWPFEELSPSKNIEHLSTSLFIINGANDAQASPNDAIILENLAKENELGVRLKIVEDEYHYLGDSWNDSLTEALSYHESTSKRLQPDK